MAGKPDRDDMWAGVSAGWAVSSYLLSAVLVWGGIGYLVDHFAGTGHVFLAIGMIAGAGLGTYLVYLRYGREDDANRTKKDHRP